MVNKGTLIYFDFTNFKSNQELEITANTIFKIMHDSITNLTKMKIVHKHLEILKQPITENGFTSVLLLDESHFTAHAYTDDDKALLAMDIFTCGQTDTSIVADYVIKEIKNYIPDIKINNFVINKRFKTK